MIHNWIEAIGDRNPIYADDAAARAAGHPGVVAPPAMIQVWTMGEQVSISSALGEVIGPKQTAVGNQ